MYHEPKREQRTDEKPNPTQAPTARNADINIFDVF